MSRFFLLMVLGLFGFASAQMLPGAKLVTAPMADSTGKPLIMDFGLNLTGIKDNTPFSVFSQRPLMIYYFSHSCPHCKNHYAGIQQIAKEYEQKGLTSIALSVSNATKRDILMFMEQQKAVIPFYHDAEGTFGKKYGDGFIPRLYIISPDGKITRYTSFESESLKGIKADIDKLLLK